MPSGVQLCDGWCHRGISTTWPFGTHITGGVLSRGRVRGEAFFWSTALVAAGCD